MDFQTDKLKLRLLEGMLEALLENGTWSGSAFEIIAACHAVTVHNIESDAEMRPVIERGYDAAMALYGKRGELH